MKILVLGMDNTGKTTLVNSLKKDLNINVKISKGPKLTKEEMDCYILAVIKANDDLLLERFCLFEEIVYGNVLRNKSNYDFNSNLYKEFIKQKNVLIIYCRPNSSKVFNFGTRFQMDGIIDNSKDLLLKYDDIYFNLKEDPNSNISVVIYDYENTSYEKLKDYILGLIKNEHNRSKN